MSESATRRRPEAVALPGAGLVTGFAAFAATFFAALSIARSLEAKRRPGASD